MFYCAVHNWFSSEKPCPACHPVKVVTATSTHIEPTTSEVSYFHVADNSDAFQDWLCSKGVDYRRSGSFTLIPYTNDIFALAMEWGVYKKENKK